MLYCIIIEEEEEEEFIPAAQSTLINCLCSTSPPLSSARHSSPPGKPTQAQTSWTEPLSALRSLEERRHFNELSPGRWSARIHPLWSVLYLASCHWASGSSSCVGRRNQTATPRRSEPDPTTRWCRGTRRPGRTLSARREENTHWKPAETGRHFRDVRGYNACVHQVATERMTHPDPRHLEGHRLYGAPGEHERHGHLHVSHVALCLGQEGQTLREQTGSDITAGLIRFN